MEMLDQLLKMITSQGEQDVIQNPAIPNELNTQVLGEAGNSIFSGLQQMLAGGGLAQVMQLLGGGRQPGQGMGIAGLLSSPVVQNMIQSFTGRLTGQYNLSPEVAQNVGQSLIPQVLSQFSQRVNDPSDSSLDFNSVLQSLTGGQVSGTDFNQLAGRLSQGGFDRDGDGDVDLEDLIGSVSSAARQQGGANFMEMVSGFLK